MQHNPKFPKEIPPNLRGIITSLAIKYAKRKPGLEIDDLIEEGIIKYSEIISTSWYNKEHISKASISTALFAIIKNHFINLSRNLTPPPTISLEDVSSQLTKTPQAEIETQLLLLNDMLTEGTSKLVLETLTNSLCSKTTVKELCDRMGISFFKYQQAERKIRSSIRELSKEL